MIRLVHSLLLKIYRRLPVPARRWVVRVIAPSFTVGAMVVIERDDGRILFVRQTYRRKWGVPGGLLKRREAAQDAAVREIAEEVGLRVELVGPPSVVVDPIPQRVDIVYRARPVGGADLDALRPMSPEIEDLAWFSPRALPELQHETAGALVEVARAARGGATQPVSLDEIGRMLGRHRAG